MLRGADVTDGRAAGSQWTNARTGARTNKQTKRRVDGPPAKKKMLKKIEKKVFLVFSIFLLKHRIVFYRYTSFLHRIMVKQLKVFNKHQR